MILDIDLGNTRLKWRKTTSDAIRAPTEAMALSKINNDMNLHLGEIPCRTRIASVRDQEANSELSAWCLSNFGHEPEFVKSSAELGRVKNGYENPESLGVDRWLAVVAAYHAAGGPTVVFDFGSAITADAVDRSGLHLGGFIAPGLQMMTSSLTTRTKLVKISGTPTLPLNPGRNTTHAVTRGVLAAAVGFVEFTWARLAERSGAAEAILTGGDAHSVAPHLGFPVRVENDLVLDGLAIALP